MGDGLEIFPWVTSRVALYSFRQQAAGGSAAGRCIQDGMPHITKLLTSNLVMCAKGDGAIGARGGAGAQAE